MNSKTLICSALALMMGLAGMAQSKRYCNPLPMPIGNGGNAAGDVTVIEEGGKHRRWCMGIR